jgi:hypothetical protein
MGPGVRDCPACGTDRYAPQVHPEPVRSRPTNNPVLAALLVAVMVAIVLAAAALVRGHVTAAPGFASARQACSQFADAQIGAQDRTMTAFDVTIKLNEAAAAADSAASLSVRWANLRLQAQRVRVDFETFSFDQRFDVTQGDLAAFVSACTAVSAP